MKKLTLLPFILVVTGCGAGATSYVHTEQAPLGRVVVYRNGVAYFERTADVRGDHLDLKVPADKVDDFLKSLTVVDAQTGKPAPISYPTKQAAGPSGGNLIDMRIGLSGPSTHKLKLTYVTEAPSWKPSYRVEVGKDGKVNLEAWAIVDNTSGEDWKDVRLGVGSSSALSFRYDLQSVRIVERETLQQNDLFAYAPPVGGATFGAHEKKLVADLDDATLAAADADVDGNADGDEEPSGAPAARAPGHYSHGTHGRTTVSGRGGGGVGPNAQQRWEQDGRVAQGGYAHVRPTAEAPPPPRAAQEVQRLAQSLQSSQRRIVVEGYATPADKDKQAASLERANRMREQLLRNGVDPSNVVAVGRGEQVGHSGGVRIVEATAPAQANAKTQADAKGGDGGAAAEPIGTSNFESGNVTTVARGTSAMVSILDGQTEGEVVYLYDPESARGNAQFPFKSVRLKNPSNSALETGPVTVFGDGRFIGEGMAEQIPARAVAFVPFALDRQIVVDQQSGDSDEISRILTVQRGVFSTEVQHKRKTTFTLHNRLGDRAVVYVRHTVAQGYKLSKVPEGAGDERLGAANLFRVEVPAHAKLDVTIEETTPVYKTIDVRSPEGIEQVRVFLSRTAAEGPLQKQVQELLKLNKQMADIQQRIDTTREQMAEYRQRMNELHDQIFTLKAVKTGGPLMVSLEKKMQEVSDKLSKATIDVVSQQEALMVARIHFQDGVADLTLEKKDDTKPELAKGGK